MRETKIYKGLKRTYFTFLYLIFARKFFFAKWVRDDGENLHLLNYPLGKNSLVVEIGGYKGYFSDKIINLYNPYLIIFEPVRSYYKFLKTRFSKNPKVKVYNKALSGHTGYENIYISKDTTSFILQSKNAQRIRVSDIGEFIKTLKPGLIDLMSVNIEGAEYKLLERMLKLKLLKKIKYLQIQFHNYLPNSAKIHRQLVKKILQTHKVRYSYPFVWEGFEVKR